MPRSGRRSRDAIWRSVRMPSSRGWISGVPGSRRGGSGLVRSRSRSPTWPGWAPHRCGARRPCAHPRARASRTSLRSSAGSAPRRLPPDAPSPAATSARSTGRWSSMSRSVETLVPGEVMRRDGGPAGGPRGGHRHCWAGRLPGCVCCSTAADALSEQERAWVGAQLAPVARVAEGLQLVSTGVRCGGDISDGLLIELERITSMSGCGAEIWLDRLAGGAGAGLGLRRRVA